MSAIYRHFDSWRDACDAAGVSSGNNGPENIKPNYSKGRDHALEQVRKTAALLSSNSLSKSQFNEHNTELRASTVARLFGGWENALTAAGLQRDRNYRNLLPIDELSLDFLQAFRDLGQIPAVRQLVRRSTHGLNTFTRKFGGYAAFKVAAIRHLLKCGDELTDGEKQVLESHLKGLATDQRVPAKEPVPYQRGRHLGFRAFAFCPTYENEVVSLFSVVAEELGFEIVCQRPAFPDCEARRLIDRGRKRYKTCRIEFELRSSDYQRHRHPLDGCDLVVCWEHDWTQCPLEVLELASVIKSLPGWK